ncbi:hypothetical protein GCM10008111_24110 [Alishewanella tabrizica]|uniref:Uncharacterized protein n=1 Tax=Alishewanella tabrizica TaxID=671278 RepID=A0ABQ2WQX6_9ALTE|nr:hypothetical protein GCM10008111_24110 [Alishewanella tabrizica]
MLAMWKTGGKARYSRIDIITSLLCVFIKCLLFTIFKDFGVQAIVVQKKAVLMFYGIE